MARATLWSNARADRYWRLGYWTGETFAVCVDRCANDAPEAVALSDERHSLRWADVKRWTDAVACGLLRCGLPRDAVLASCLPNGIEHYLVRTAAEKAGLIWLPIPWAASPRDLRAILELAQASALVIADSERAGDRADLREWRASLPHLQGIFLAGGGTSSGTTPLDELVDRRPAPSELALLAERSYRSWEVAMIHPTSGSTGTPKLCEYVLAGAMARGRAQAELFHLTAHDVIVATVQGFGPNIIPLLAAPVVGAEVVALDRHDPETLIEIVQKRKATIVCAVPPIYQDLADHARQSKSELGSVRIWYSTGMAMPVNLARSLEDLTEGVVLSGYGGVDLGCWASPAPEDPPAVRWYTVGKPRGGSELRLVHQQGGPLDEGEVWGRGPSSTTGYFRDPDSSRKAWTRDGWFRTGDIGRWDPQGNLILWGRKVEVINRGGQKIFPEEIEQVLEKHPGIARAALVPYEDQRLGQRACVYVVPARGADIRLEEVVRFLRAEGMAAYKLPERLESVTSLPLTSSGKIARPVLRADLARKLAETSDERAHHG